MVRAAREPPKFAPGIHEQEAWVTFAAAALGGYAASGDETEEVEARTTNEDVELAARAADMMLAEMRRRR